MKERKILLLIPLFFLFLTHMLCAEGRLIAIPPCIADLFFNGDEIDP